VATRPEIRADIKSMVGEMFTDPEIDTAIRLAMGMGWPELCEELHDDSITLISGVREYGIDAADVTNKGFWQAWVGEPGKPRSWVKLLGGIKARKLEGAWSVVVSDEVLSYNAGKTLRLWYYAPYAALANDDAETEMCLPYIVFQACYFLCQRAVSDRDHFNVEGYRQVKDQWAAMADRARGQHRRKQMPKTIEENW